MSKIKTWINFDQMISERTGVSPAAARRHIKGDNGCMVLGYGLDFLERGDQILIHTDDADKFIQRLQDWNRCKALLP